MKNGYIIAVDIQLSAPMHIGAVEKGRYDFASGKRTYGEQGVQAALTRKQALAGGREELPVIPASTISGKLRRAAAQLIFDSWIARGITTTPMVCNMMSSGASTAELKAPTIDSRMAARRDAFMRLFGGSSFMEHADSVISIGWPIIAKTEKFLMSEPLSAVVEGADGEETKGWQMTEFMAVVRKDDVQDMAIKDITTLISAEALAEYYQKLSGDKTKRSKSKEEGAEDGGKTALRTLNAFEAVRTGTRFALRVKVGSTDPAHLGLMLLAMQSLLRDGTFGGKAAKGLGAFTVEGSRLIEIDEDFRQKSVMAKLFEGKETGYALGEKDVVQAAAEAATDYIHNADVSFFEAIANGNTDFFSEKKAA